MRITGYPCAPAAQASPVPLRKTPKGQTCTARSYPGGNAIFALQARHLRHGRSWLRRKAHRPPPRPQSCARRSRRCDAVSIRFCRRRSVKSGTLTLTCVPPNPCRMRCSEKNSPHKDLVKTHSGAFYDQKRVAKSPRSSTYHRAAYPTTRFKPAKRPSKGLQTIHRRKYNRPSKGLNHPPNG